MIDTLTNRQLVRLYEGAYDRMARLFTGGDQYGIDWRTLRAVSPSWHRTMNAITGEIQRRVNNRTYWRD